MSRQLVQFIFKILIASGLLAAAGWAGFTFAGPQFYLPVLPWMLLFFALVTIATHGYQLRLAKKSMALFTRSSMLISFFRLAIYSVFAIVYISNDSKNAAAFVVCLAVVYLVFTFIEVTELSRIAKQNQK